MKELEEMKKCFDEFMAKAEQTYDKSIKLLFIY